MTSYKRPPTAALGQRIRHLRLAAGLSQKDIARSLGRSDNYVSQIERGTMKPSASAMAGLAELLKVDTVELAALCSEDGDAVELAIQRNGRLTLKQRDALLTHYRSYLA